MLVEGRSICLTIFALPVGINSRKAMSRHLIVRFARMNDNMSATWVQRLYPVIEFWEGETIELKEGVSLHRCGGHFEGSTVLLWPDGADGKGVLLTGDTMYVAPDRKHVSFMYSYPNFIPLSASTVDSIFEKVMPLKFDRIYGHFFGLEIEADAKAVIRQSAERYKKAIGVAG